MVKLVAQLFLRQAGLVTFPTTSYLSYSLSYSLYNSPTVFLPIPTPSLLYVTTTITIFILTRSLLFLASCNPVSNQRQLCLGINGKKLSLKTAQASLIIGSLFLCFSAQINGISISLSAYLLFLFAATKPRQLIKHLIVDISVMQPCTRKPLNIILRLFCFERTFLLLTFCLLVVFALLCFTRHCALACQPGRGPAIAVCKLTAALFAPFTFMPLLPAAFLPVCSFICLALFCRPIVVPHLPYFISLSTTHTHTCTHTLLPFALCTARTACHVICLFLSNSPIPIPSVNCSAIY